MSKSPWLTPEQAREKKELKKKLIYISFFVGIIFFSALFTILGHQL
ncbi:hypothetical protein [Bacillus sp. 03113]|nr:hypothetical protein [Bacillus sp. 03113]